MSTASYITFVAFFWILFHPGVQPVQMLNTIAGFSLLFSTFLSFVKKDASHLTITLLLWFHFSKISTFRGILIRIFVLCNDQLYNEMLALHAPVVLGQALAQEHGGPEIPCN